MKERAKDVLRLSREVKRLRNQMAEVNMMDAVKAGMVYKLSEVMIELGTAYRNLSKELTYYISTMPSTNYPE